MSDKTAAPVPVHVVPDSRLDALLAEYAGLAPQFAELEARVKAIKDGIKRELQTAAPGAEKIDVRHPALAGGLRLSYVSRWDIDVRRMKAEDPTTYVKWAVKGGRWELRAVSG